LELLKTITFSELNEISFNKILIREAACLQNIRLVSESLCNYKSECNSNKYCCKKAGENCNSRYHSRCSYQNINDMILPLVYCYCSNIKHF